MARSRLERIAVVVPAHQEAALISGAIRALTAAAEQVADQVETTIIVVANGCTDGTAELARVAGAIVIEAAEANVGGARAAGCAWAVSRLGEVGGLWLATTDADSSVGSNWLVRQLEASRVADVYLGTVALHPHVHRTFADWIARYHADFEAPERHGHVHGASMGLRAETYLRAGGFRALVHSEDVDLVERLVAAGEEILWDETSPVLTSARLVARAPDGVARDLALAAEVGHERGILDYGSDSVDA